MSRRGELLLLGTPKIWDLPAANYQAGFHTFTIPQVVERTMMTVELSIDIGMILPDKLGAILFFSG